MANPLGIGGQKAGEPGRNPKGRPPGRQSFLDRARYLMEEHKITDIKKFISDEKKFDQLSVFDGIIIRRIAEAYADGGRQSMESLLDRLMGKPTQYVESKNQHEVAMSVEDRRRAAEKEAEELLKKAAQRNKK